MQAPAACVNPTIATVKNVSCVSSSNSDEKNIQYKITTACHASTGPRKLFISSRAIITNRAPVNVPIPASFNVADDNDPKFTPSASDDR